MNNLSETDLYQLYLDDKNLAFKIIYIIMKRTIQIKFPDLPYSKKEEALSDSVTALLKIDVTKIKKKESFRFYCAKIAFRKGLKHSGYKKSNFNKENHNISSGSYQFENKFIKPNSQISIDFIENFLFASENHMAEQKNHLESTELKIQSLKENLENLDENCKFYLNLKFRSIKYGESLKKISAKMNLSYDNTRRKISNCYKKIRELLEKDKKFMEVR